MKRLALRTLVFMMLLFDLVMLQGLVETAMNAKPVHASTIPRYSTTYSRSQATAVLSGKVKANYCSRSGHPKYHRLGTYQRSCMLTLINRESSFRNWVTNGSYHGLGQLSAGMAHGHPWWQPNWNTDRMLHYIIGRYGTPSVALRHSYRYGWY